MGWGAVGEGYQWVAILNDLTQLLLVVSQPCDFAIETFLAQGQVCAVSWGVFTITGKYLHLNDLFPIYATTHLYIPTLLNLSVSVF